MDRSWNPISRLSKWIAGVADLRESTVTDWWRVNVPTFPFIGVEQSRGIAHQQMTLPFPPPDASRWDGRFASWGLRPRYPHRIQERRCA